MGKESGHSDTEWSDITFKLGRGLPTVEISKALYDHRTIKLFVHGFKLGWKLQIDQICASYHLKLCVAYEKR